MKERTKFVLEWERLFGKQQGTVNMSELHLRRLQPLSHPLRREYNHERPHEALGQKCPATRYRPSERLELKLAKRPRVLSLEHDAFDGDQ